MSQEPIDDDAVAGAGVRAVLRIDVFRRFWLALGVASLADWMGLLALTAFANAVAGGDDSSQNFAIASVLFVRVAPALVIAPFGGYIADRVDRRSTLVVGLVLRGIIFATIPLVGTLWWLLVATVLVEAVNAVWMPTKDAMVPTLVPRRMLEDGNRLNLATTYGSALPAAVLFVALTAVTKAVDAAADGYDTRTVDPTLYAVAAAFVVGGLICLTMRGMPRGSAVPLAEQAGVWRTIADGWSYVARTPLVRGLVIGIVGAFAAGGVVIGLGRVFVSDLGAGDPGYGVLFGSVFLGLGLGMWRGPRVVQQVSRRRLFGLSLVSAGVFMVFVAVVGHMAVVAVLVVGVGFSAGIAWITGYTLLGLEVADDVRGRAFAFVQSLVRLALALVLAAAPLVAGLIGTHQILVTENVTLAYSGTQLTFLLAATAAIVFGIVAFRHMNDRPGVSLFSEITGDPAPSAGSYADEGVFVALEGGEGAGKSTQATRIRDRLTSDGYDVLLTHEPGDTRVGSALRQILLDPATGELSARTEMLLYAADKSEHVDTVVRPALAAGKVVVTDRYVDSTLAYQGAGRALSRDEVEPVARWATGELRPHLTVLLDVAPEVGLARFDGHDRLEAEPREFHARVRASFLELAAADPEHYLVLDADRSPDEIEAAIRKRLAPMLSGAVRTTRSRS